MHLSRPTSNPMRRLAILAASSILALGAVFAGGPAYASPINEPSQPVAASEAGPLAWWAQYDGAHITTPEKCEARRQQLIRDVAWITASNSDCWVEWSETCPSSQYWVVMVLTNGFASESAIEPTSTPLVAACG